MASLFSGLSGNYSLYTIPAAWMLAFAPHVYSVNTYEAASKKPYHMREPRSFTRRLEEDETIDAKTKGRIQRAEGAQANGFENLGLYAAAVVAANIAGVDNKWLNILSGTYIASRYAYNKVYIANDDVAPEVRTAVFFIGIGAIFTLIIKAGNAVRLA
ncbi:hypothetical protein M501DRAFT_1010091 [Patellaria atrata CBS 101060]|uniref:Uncharacterized protein n=1 Tax=Patellaria atrata CBS 101060 TaxID=1346257 RepID=A0A9P4VTG4_9PEZI|nr:hypothetical protein M501DRAFT_1010091 [Patellaria atrata CBS 101060]